MPAKSYDPRVVNIFAKYEIPINFKNTIYETVDHLLSCQIVTSVVASKEVSSTKGD